MSLPRIIAAAAIGTAAPAFANSVAVSFTFDDLRGEYSTSSGVFNANATNVPGFRSSGDVSRLLGANPSQIGNAAFRPGFTSESTQANFQLQLTVGGINADGTRSGSGSFTVTDLDGDTIRGDINGRWADHGGVFADFVGTLSNVSFTGTFFNGQIGDGWDMSVLNNQTWSGAVVALTSNVGNFFRSNFDSATTGVSGQVVIPLPPAAWAGLGTLGVVGAGAAVRRRKLQQ